MVGRRGGGQLMGRRVVALAAAAAMIAGALWFRHRRDNKTSSASRPHITCATEVGVVCDAVSKSADVTVESASTTAARLSKTDSTDIDAWVTAGPWPQLVDEARERAGRTRFFTRYDTAIARSPLVAAVFPDRGRVLSAKCGGPITWKCIGDAA